MNSLVIKALPTLDESNLKQYGFSYMFSILAHFNYHLLICNDLEKLDEILAIPGILSISEEVSGRFDGDGSPTVPYQSSEMLYAISAILAMSAIDNATPAMERIEKVCMDVLTQGYAAKTDINHMYFNRGVYLANAENEAAVE